MGKCCEYTPGMLRTTIIPVSITQVVSATGNPTISMVDGTALKCKWETLSATKLIFGYKNDMVTKIKVICRWNESITSVDKIKHDDLIHDITSIRRLQEPNGRYMEILLDGGTPEVNVV